MMVQSLLQGAASSHHQGAGPQIISMCLIMRCTPNSALVDRVDFAAPLSLSSRSVTDLSALAPAQRAGAQRLCAMALLRHHYATLACPLPEVKRSCRKHSAEVRADVQDVGIRVSEFMERPVHHYSALMFAVRITLPHFS